MLISVYHTVNNLGIQCCCSFSFHEQSHHQNAVAERTATGILRALCAQECGIITFQSHSRSLLEKHPIIFGHMRKVSQIALENVQEAFTKNPGPSSSLCHGARRELLMPEPLRHRPVKMNLAFFLNFFTMMFILLQTSYMTLVNPRVHFAAH